MDLSKARQISPTLDAKGMKFAFVVSRYNGLVTKQLLEGGMETLLRHGAAIEDQTVIWAPGGFEIPLLAKGALEKGGFDAVVALGCVMKGETPHNDYISAQVASGLAGLALEYTVPVAFGVLTPDTAEQALARSGLKMGNKGAEATLAAIESALALRALRG